MDFGYFNQLQLPRPWAGDDAEQQLYHQALDQAVHAEAVGFQYYWQTEHHFYTEIGHSSAPELFLAALTQRTRAMRLGCGVVVLPCNHPFRVAEQAATLDVLSNGRLELGTGRGASPYHTEAFGVTTDASRAVWEEALRAICGLFLHDPFPGHRGPYYDLPPRSLVPKPVQKPHPPLWVAATSSGTFESAARMGLGVLAFGVTSPEDLAPSVQAYRANQVDCQPIGGYANHRVAAFSICYVDEDDARGRAVACAAARWYLGDNEAELQQQRFSAFPELRSLVERLRRTGDDELIERGMVIGGDPDTVSRQIERWAGLGIDQLMLMIQGGRTTHEQVLRAQELIGRHVIPRFMAPVGTPAASGSSPLPA